MPGADSSLRIEPMGAGDWPAVCAIYEEGIATGVATFKTEAPSWPEWDAARLPHSPLVARAASGVVGWAALTAGADRAARRCVARYGAHGETQPDCRELD